MRKKTTLQTKSDINHFNPSSRTPPTAKGGNNPPFAVGGGRTRLPHSPTAKGGPTLHGGWAYLHGGQSPISPQLKTNVLPPPAVFSCGNRNAPQRVEEREEQSCSVNWDPKVGSLAWNSTPEVVTIYMKRSCSYVVVYELLFYFNVF